MGIHINVLEAIALYRKKDSLWKEKLNSALDAAQEFGFIRTYKCIWSRSAFTA